MTPQTQSVYDALANAPLSAFAGPLEAVRVHLDQQDTTIADLTGQVSNLNAAATQQPQGDGGASAAAVADLQTQLSNLQGQLAANAGQEDVVNQELTTANQQLAAVTAERDELKREVDAAKAALNPPAQ